ncbi:MAG TPA: hypothetical protein VK426_00640, partial [Methanobacterium sp.]|nr:hypothetical protein [Methanobacterium sp.]
FHDLYFRSNLLHDLAIYGSHLSSSVKRHALIVSLSIFSSLSNLLLTLAKTSSIMSFFSSTLNPASIVAFGGNL